MLIVLCCFYAVHRSCTEAILLAASIRLLFSPSGSAQAMRMHSTHTKVNITKAKCSSNGNPSLKPSLIDHAKALPVITGAKALKAKYRTRDHHLLDTQTWRAINEVKVTLKSYMGAQWCNG